MDQAKMETFLGKTVADMATTLTVAGGYIGDQLGFYRALHGAGPLTTEQLADRTDTNARLVREWC
ncbi:MAG: SAM-dependent methyltransferase, partial [Actinomycetia bacterium]|nr:SAM-dependent methyltransferase [Actinomycetes bacterium]